MRQAVGLIRPSPDGSHRPKAEFAGSARKPPAGGFVPHAPNAVRVVRQRRQTMREMHEEQIPARRRHATGSGTVPDYADDGYSDAEETYRSSMDELPRHSSTIVTVGPLPRIDVQRRVRTIEVYDKRERSRSAAAHARPDRSRSPSAQRSRERMHALTRASPSPASYERALSYKPPALPPKCQVEYARMHASSCVHSSDCKGARSTRDGSGKARAQDGGRGAARNFLPYAYSRTARRKARRIKPIPQTQ